MEGAGWGIRSETYNVARNARFYQVLQIAGLFLQDLVGQ